eukprot:m.19411 g.19411  ORF g.19411 m.19411 type:complete len:295 (+) comp11825_c1_seq2:529-1413(+)
MPSSHECRKLHSAWMFACILLITQCDGSLEIGPSAARAQHFERRTSQQEYWIQIGKPRTATTLQFETLCACLFLRHRRNRTALENLTCQYLFPPERGIHNDPPSSEHAVVKTHIWLRKWDGLSSPESMTIFGTRAKNTTSTTLPRGYSYAFVMDTAMVTKWGQHSIYAYQDLLGLTDDDMAMLNKFIEYWDILRLCCGAQMSESWRGILDPTQRRKHHPSHFHGSNNSSHRCHVYNISAVEVGFRETALYQQMAQFHQLLPMLRPSTIDGDLDGTYCERYNARVRTKHVQHMVP